LSIGRLAREKWPLARITNRHPVKFEDFRSRFQSQKVTSVGRPICWSFFSITAHKFRLAIVNSKPSKNTVICWPIAVAGFGSITGTAKNFSSTRRRLRQELSDPRSPRADCQLWMPILTATSLHPLRCSPSASLAEETASGFCSHTLVKLILEGVIGTSFVSFKVP
jgi:hypothetical protein